MNLEEWKKKYGAGASEPSSDLQQEKQIRKFYSRTDRTPQKKTHARGIQAFGAGGTNIPITPQTTSQIALPTPKIPTIDPRYAAIPQAQDYAELSTVPKTEKKGVIGLFQGCFHRQ